MHCPLTELCCPVGLADIPSDQGFHNASCDFAGLDGTIRFFEEMHFEFACSVNGGSVDPRSLSIMARTLKCSTRKQRMQKLA